MSTPSYDMLVGACAAHGLGREGDAATLRRRLGDHLVAQLFAGTVGGKRAGPAGPRTSPSAAKRPATAWHAFLKGEKERVKAAGFAGGEVQRECARRWALFKRVSGPDAPLMLGEPAAAGSSTAASSTASDDDGGTLLEALQALEADEVKEALEAHGLPAPEEHAANVAALAAALLA